MRRLTLPSRLARTSCSMLALATVLVVGGTPAGAQSFLGDGLVTSGSGTITNNVSGITNITVTTPQTVIDWTPFDNAIANNTTIAFQNAGTTASFSGSGNYAVLNRIIPADSTRSITMNGTIQSILAGAGPANGSIYFYSPGGFVIGADARINVGSLVLSASPLLLDGSGNFITGGSNVTFGQALRPGASIITTAGSQINATAGDAYVAMVAPRVEHRGSINVSGSAALVGAEAATINFSPDGLFDIQVTTGTTDANGVYNSGTITGPASTGAADIHRAYLVAVPKNSALTMAIIQGSSLGFNIAGAANVDGNTVVLSAGYNVTDGVIDPFLASAGGANKANLSVNGATATSALTAAASGVADIFSIAGQASNFASNVTVRAVDHVWVNASGSAATLNIAGNLDMSSTHWPSVDGQSNTGGFLALYAGLGGTVSVGGNASLISLGSGGSSAIGGMNGGSGTGGQIWVQSEGNSSLSIGGDLTAWAGGYGGDAGATGANGGAGTGGQILIRKFGASSLLSVGGTTSANADGYGGDATACGGCSGAGGIGTGGQISVYSDTASGSTMTLSDAVFLYASGRGGSSANGGAGGGGAGGSVILSAGAGSTLALNDRLHADASGFGGSGSTGGSALGGNISLYSAGTLTIGGTDPTFILTEATGGMGLSAAAGDGQGGTITIIADEGGSLTLTNSLFASADGRGGDAGGAGADGGDGTGGTIALYPTGNGSSIAMTAATLHADGYGGRGDGLECFTCNGDGGDGTGGETFVGDGFYFSSLSANDSINFTGSLTMAANGTGGVGVGVSGDGMGGSAELSWYATTTGSVTGNLSISSVGRGGDNFDGGMAGNGNGFGAIVGPDGGLTLGANLYLDASGIGGSTFGIGGGTGGIGDGGVARLFNGLGTITIAGNHEGIADGVGGNAYLGIGGDGIGGLAPLNAFESTIAISGSAKLSASGHGGHGDNGGGDGTGMIARLLTSNGTITIGGSVTVEALGVGGNGATGGGAFGGDALIWADSGGTIELLGETNIISASETGGNGLGSGNGGIAAGAGEVRIYADGVESTVTFSGATRASSNATGGNSDANVGGSAHGGDIDIYAQNSGSLTFDSDLTVSADATGGSGASGGGYAEGGAVSIFSFAALQVDGALTAHANATGGSVYFTDFSGNSAGDALGGDIDVYAENGLLTLVGAVTLSTDATGGYAGNSQDFGGDGTGGYTRLFANAGGTVGLQSTLDATAIGRGGGTNGSGFGGTGNTSGGVRVQANGANATVTVAGAAMLDASGFGANGGECFDCDAGNGTGGMVWADAFGATTALLDFNSNVSLYARGSGGGTFSGAGGNGQGGQALLQASAGSNVSVGGDAVVNTDAFGGYSYDFSDGVGGNATGGVSRIQAFAGTGSGGTIDIDGSATISANGEGGASYSYVGGTGGDGTGGTAQLYASPGTVTIGTVQTAGGASLSADGYGGDASNGTGGDGTGGELAEIWVQGGDITIEGFASVSASGFGGDGLYGGNGLGSGEPFELGGGEGGAHIFAQNGDIVIKGGASVVAVGTGGDGGWDNNGYNNDHGGDGGRGTGGWATIFAANSNLGPSLISIVGGLLEGSGFATVDVSGTGGNGGDGNSGNAGGNGGNGGDGTGGTGSITAAAGNGTVTITNAAVHSIGDGGDGGHGGNGDGLPGGNGGDGGNGVGGFGTIGTASGNPQSLGVNNGFGDYGSIIVNSSAFGGAGGDGNFGSTSGDGGNGGDATAGSSVLLVRGSRVDFDTASLIADATGGDGGLGDGETSFDGDGGNATVGGDGGIGVLVTERFQVPAHRGTLNGGSIIGTAIATAGVGDIDGISQTLGGNLVIFRNSDGDLDSLDFLIQADDIGVGAVVDAIALLNGDVIVDGAFNFVTDGTLSLFADLGDFTADTFTLHAADFVPDTVTVTPANAGTFFANSFDIQTGNNFLTTAHLDSIEALSIVAPGAIFIGNVTGDDDIILEAQGGQVDIGNVLAGGGIDIDALTYINTGNITGNGVIDLDAVTSIGTGDINNEGNTSLNAGTTINVGSIDSGSGSVTLVTNSSYISGSFVTAGSIYADSGSDIFLGNLTAAGDIELVAVSDILVGNALAGESIDLDAGGYVDGGNMTAGDSVYVTAGGYIDLLDISAGIVNQSSGYDADYNVGILAGTTIDTGDIEALNSIGLGAQGNIYTGSIDAGNIFLALGGGNMSFGVINAGGVTYLADDSMIPLGGDPSDGDFDPAPILGATPVASGGSIELRGAVVAGQFVAAAGSTLAGSTITSDSSIYTVSGGNTTLTDLDAGTTIFQRSNGVITENDLDAGGFIDIRSAGGMALGDLVAGDYIDLRSNAAIGLGNATSGETINFLTGGTLTGGTMTAGDSVLGEAMGAIQLGAISAGITDQSIASSANYAARFSSGAAITTGTVNALGDIGFGTPTNLTTGALTSGGGLMALVGGNISVGTTGASDYVYLANYSMAALGGAFLTFDRAPVLALAPVATGGSIALGAVDTGRFEAAAGTTLTGTTINSNGLLYATSGGNMALGNLFAGNDVRLTSGGNISTGSIDSGNDVALIAAGSISTLDIFAYDDVSADAGTTITTDDITGSTIDLFADGDITTDDLLTQDFFSGFEVLSLVAGASVTIHSGGDIDTGDIDSLDGVHAHADGGITTGTIDAEDFVELFAGGNITAGTINAGSNIDIFSDTGLLDLDDLHAGTQIDLESDGSLLFGDATADDFNFEMGGSVNGGNIDAITHADGEAEGAIVLKNITVTGPPSDDDFSIGFSSATSITVENVDGFDRVGFATLGDLTTGNLTAGSLVMTMVGGNTVTGSITTDSGGRVYMADASMFETGGGLEEDGDFDASIVLALDPVPTGGSILINGPVTTGQFQAAAGGNFTAHAIDADRLYVYSQATATIDGMWNVPDVTLVSNDIDITANGGIDGGSAGQVTLNSIHAEGALIGDGLTGSGYALSNAEFGRISGADDLTIIAGGYAGAAADTMVGDLTITGPLAGSNIESNGGGVHFVTLNESGTELDGTLRIVGNVVATGFGADNYLAFYTQNFELDAATGSISITSSGDALAGTLELYASRIHVAEGSLLDQLAANPQFAGYREALNQQAAVQRPEGVIRAANFDIGFGGGDNNGPYTLFVQNMGTTTVPAGFLLNAANIGDDGEGSLAPGSVDMAINGQIIAEGGTLTGIAVRDLLVTEFGTEAFVAGSTINGCALVGPCTVAPPPPPPKVDTPTSTDIQLSDTSGLGDGLFGNEGDIDDGESGGDDQSSPISPPNPLFDSRPLTQSADVDDPVSGAGNPSLYGDTSDEEAAEDCDNRKDASCKLGTKGDGK